MSLLRFVSPCLLAMAIASAPGCTSDGSRSASSTGPMGLVAEPPADGAAVFLRPQLPDPAAPNRVVIDVIARGAAELHGAAFRVTWDPQALGFVSAQSGPMWSKQALALAKEGSPGQLAVAWTEKGETGIDASAETALGSLTFDVRSRKGTALDFKTERSQLVDKKGARLDVRWRGGSITSL